MNWFKKNVQPATQAIAQVPVAPPVVDLEKKIAEGVKKALYSAKYKDVQAKLKTLLATYVPVSPRYKIRQHPEGGYIILQLKVVHKTISDASKIYDGYMNKLLPSLDDLEVFDLTPVEKYVTLRMKNVTGEMIDRRFDNFTMAEFYLYRMAEPEKYDTNYDGDPLRRV